MLFFISTNNGQIHQRHCPYEGVNIIVSHISSCLSQCLASDTLLWWLECIGYGAIWGMDTIPSFKSPCMLKNPVYNQKLCWQLLRKMGSLATSTLFPSFIISNLSIVLR